MTQEKKEREKTENTETYSVSREEKELVELFKSVKGWASDKDLLHRENVDYQILKVNEEIGELNGALARKDAEGIIDGIGDGFVTLIILSHQIGISPKKALLYAWNEIKDRTGETKNGVFVKDEEKQGEDKQ